MAGPVPLVDAERFLPSEFDIGMENQDEKAESRGFSYDSLAAQRWVDIWWRLLLAFLLAAALAIAVRRTNLGRRRCYVAATFILSFLVLLLIFGNKFLKNVSVFFLGAILLTSVVTIFIFLMYDLVHC